MFTTIFIPQTFSIARAILHFPIMLALCLMLQRTYYAHNYAGIIGGSLSLKQGSGGVAHNCKTLDS